MKKHRQWTVLSAYFKDLPADKELIKHINDLMDNGDNVLVMIKKENHEDNPRFKPEEKLKSLYTLFPKESLAGRFIISLVPDISHYIDYKI